MSHVRSLVAALAFILPASVPVVGLAQAEAHDPHAGHDHAAHDQAAPSAAKAAAAPDAVVAEQLPTYPLDTCVVSGEPLAAMGKPVDFVHEGRLIRFCCPMCEKKFAADPAKYLAKIDAAVIEAQLPDYPLTVCPVSGKELGAMGEPYDHVSGTRLVRFCCGGCLEAFNDDPAAYLAKVDAAAETAPQAEGE
jgi:YHS domain-containing protein